MNIYIIENGQQKGPFTIDQLRLMNITPDTEVWMEGMYNWTTAASVPELKELLEAQGQTQYQQAGYQQPYGAQAGYQQPYGAQAGYQQPYGAQAGYQQPYGAQAGYQQPYGAQPGYQQPYGPQAGYQPTGIPPKTWMVESILVLIFCCLPFGIVGVVYASKVSGLFAAGRYAEAEQASRDAGKWTKIGFFIGLTVIVLYFVVCFGFGVALFNGASKGGFYGF